MHVFIYGGSDPYNSLKPIIEKNAQAAIGTEYVAALDQGMFIIAYPSAKDVDTDLAFDYWVAEGAPSETPQKGDETVIDDGSNIVLPEEQTSTNNNPKNTTTTEKSSDKKDEGLASEDIVTIVGAAVGGALLILLIGCTVTLFIQKKKKVVTKIQAIELETQSNITNSRPQGMLPMTEPNLTTNDNDEKYPNNLFDA